MWCSFAPQHIPSSPFSLLSPPFPLSRHLPLLFSRIFFWWCIGLHLLFRGPVRIVKVQYYLFYCFTSTLTYLTHCRQSLLHARCIQLMLWGKPRHTHISPLDRPWKHFPSLPCVTRCCGLCEKTASIAPVAAQG